MKLRKAQRKKMDPISYDWLYEHRIEKAWTLQQIGDKLNLTRERVRQILLETDIGKPESTDYFSRNTGNMHACVADIFSTIDSEEKAYWLGFATSKGRVIGTPNGRMYFTISFVNQKKEMIDRFMAFIHAEDFIHNKYRNDSLHIYHLNSHDFCRSLLTHNLAVSDRMIGGFSELVPHELLKHYMRGYFDNRESFVKVDSKYSPYALSIYGSEQFLIDWTDHMNSILSKPYQEKSLRPGNGVNHYKKLLTRNKTIIKETALYLYGEATVYDHQVASKFDQLFEHLERQEGED